MFVKICKIINKIFFWLLGILVFGALAFSVGFKIYTGDYYRADSEVISEIADKSNDQVQVFSDDDLFVFVPSRSEAKAVIVFYPGGKVEYQAYSGLMYELADRGFLCLLPRMPENLAFLRSNAADIIKSQYPDAAKYAGDLDWYLAGHSLGGVAATTYLGEQEDGEYKGIILCASYPGVDLSQKDVRLLSIYGSEDTVLNMDNYDKSRTFWPSDSEEYVIDGGIHSYFGSYGIQKGDGNPSITNLEQIEIAADVISSFICE